MQNRFSLYTGDSLEVLRTMPDNSVDSVVTDPPYGLSFMGKKWDYDVPTTELWAEVLRVLKPGGHLLAFAGTRTQHRMAMRIEDAGFEIRDMIAWVYGSGFPKSLDVSKAIDKAAGVEREVVGTGKGVGKVSEAHGGASVGGQSGGLNFRPGDIPITAPATPEAAAWQGWGTALKPALEPITLARKPLTGTVAVNVLEWGTGGLNIGGSRVEAEARAGWTNQDIRGGQYASNPDRPRLAAKEAPEGRWPANLIHDGSDEVVGLFPGADDKSAARFFYQAKASAKDRDEGLDTFTSRPSQLNSGGIGRACSVEKRLDAHGENAPTRKNNHPTVKPTALMAYLCRLITPPSGVILDPFMGSGSTGKAAMQEGFRFVGIDLNAEYVEIARARIETEARAQVQHTLPFAAE